MISGRNFFEAGLETSEGNLVGGANPNTVNEAAMMPTIDHNM
jgi:hypothetical protein